MIKKTDIINKIHLIISVCIVFPVSYSYGFISDLLLEINPKSIDEFSFLKSIMFLYIGFSILWIIGIFNYKYLKVAIISNMIFMLSLALGRLLSLVLDGIPSFAYVFGTFAELFLGLYGIFILNRLNRK
ncbi:MAG: DUF4345 domain-containing protein [Flavobacteriaceae bacterium]|nr:DUF4345 domain-containing protein [Bacteroidia bacterium]NNK81549.1 DUF4345 domain-containing protein [Flavobacteriaceae bacterium]